MPRTPLERRRDIVVAPVVCITLTLIVKNRTPPLLPSVKSSTGKRADHLEKHILEIGSEKTESMPAAVFD